MPLWELLVAIYRGQHLEGWLRRGEGGRGASGTAFGFLHRSRPAKYLDSILESSGDIWKRLEAYENIWGASRSICKASGDNREASGLLDGASLAR